ncbi:GNAT family N-acetyltransferase [Alcaligenes aquatilis]|uniref:GNAT family N-acetyltransferase n=1 Tax=Alcaligenes aquatilis TaxID=323284 RepID=UPI003F921BFB
MTPIHTDRLVLRNFQAQDALGLFEYLHTPVVSCFYSLALENSGAAEQEIHKRSSDDSQIAVSLAESGLLIGDLFADKEEDTFSVGWNFNPRFSGKGYAYEAAHALFADLFIQQGARRIYAYVEESNGRSQRLCEKLGMRKEGVFLEFISFCNDAQGNPIYENTIQYAILYKEWLKK